MKYFIKNFEKNLILGNNSNVEKFISNWWNNQITFTAMWLEKQQACWVKTKSSTSGEEPPTVKHGGGHVMVWDCCVVSVTGHLADVSQLHRT